MPKNKLHKIKNSGFKLPDDYINKLEDQIMGHIKIDEAKTSGFNIPENYLDSLEDSILEKVSGKENTKVISLFDRKTLIYISGIAAAILLMFALGVFNNVDPYSQLDNELVENYILAEDISSYEIASLMTDEELIEDNFIENEFIQENLEDYLLDNLDIEDLITE